MKITKIIACRRARQFENNNPKGQVTAEKWQILFEVAGLFYQTELPGASAGAVSVRTGKAAFVQTQPPKLADVQKHINEHPESAKPNIALQDPVKGLGFTFHES